MLVGDEITVRRNKESAASDLPKRKSCAHGDNHYLRPVTQNRNGIAIGNVHHLAGKISVGS